MTRDTSGPVAQDTSKSDDDVYAALWQAAPFPRLPPDAPNELKKLTINIEDPRRIYAIHRASRRHHFQILVERYIIQLRYGCQASYCTTSTCFTCRKRLAGGAPVRRYNATSARTLAVYLASQDNPELGLCQHPSISPPEPQVKNSSPLSKKPSKHDHGVNKSSGAPKNASEVPRPKIKVEVSTEKLERKNSRKSRTRQDSNEKPLKNSRERKNTLEDSPVARMLNEPSKKDHKSFVQNVFGTTAFKMLEWLSPRNFELLMKSESEELARRQLKASPVPTSSADDVSRPTSAEASNIKITDNGNKCVEEKTGEMTNNKQKAHMKGDGTKPTDGQRASAENDQYKKGSELDTHGVHSPKTHDDFVGANTIPTATIESKLASNATTRNTASKGRRNSRAKVLDSKPAKDILNTPTSPRIQSYSPDLHTASREPKSSKPERKLSRHTSLASPGIDEELEVGSLERKMRPLPIRSPDNVRFDPSETKELSKPTPPRLEPEVAHENQEAIANESIKKANNTSTLTEVLLPQSLSQLSIEIIDLLCDILQEDHTFEKHSFVPAHIPNMSSTRKRTLSYSGLSRSSRSQLPPAASSRLKTQWSTFIEQSLFDVLSNPDALLRSFCDEEGILFDTHTIWYLMLRMTRVAPSVVFHSLWVVAGNLFTPPNGLELELSKTEMKPRSNHSISNTDAAQIMTICLNALVAAAPHVTSASQLSNMSRTRSFGQLSMLGRDSTPMSLCLQYEDAFTNDLCLRLARRLFAAIPTRRRYTELAEINSDTTVPTEPDLLQSIFSSLKFLDLRPSVLDFTNAERDLHEKRLPTLILDWARTVMMQDWQGTAEVSRDGSFGGALAMIAAIYENRKSLLLGDIHFYSTYFNERLDSMEMPVEWLSFESNKRTVHLLDYPYLFNPSTLVTYFRSINFSRMSRSFEAARSMQAFAHYTAAEKQLMIDAQRRHKLYERLRTATSKFNVLHIRRDNVLVDAFNHIWRREERELMRPLKIRLGEESGEEGSDSGGVQQEFFRLAIAEALNPDYGTFTIDQRTKMTWFQPGSPEPLWKFELIGLIVSLAVYNGLTLPVTFPKALYRKLLDQDITELHHISDGWPDLANGLTTLLEWDEKEGSVEDIFCRTYEFSVEQFGQPISRTMNQETHWPQFSDSEKLPNPTDAPLVTGENRSEYVTDYVHWLTDVSVHPQFEAFKRGFFTCINPRSITLFTPEILQSVVEGVQEIDIADLRRYTRYVGWDASHKTVKDFWSVVKKYDFEQKRKLLEFVTASDRVPVGGMRNLQFVVQRNGVGDGHLPTSYTCYGTLLLPEYSSKEVLREKVAMALENSKGFGFA